MRATISLCLALWGKIFHLSVTQPGWLYAAAAKLLQSCPTLCDPIDSSLPGSPVPGILQARTLEWVAISFSKSWKWKVKVKSLSCVRLLATPWTAAHQAPPSMGFSRQEYWSGVPLPSPGWLYIYNQITYLALARTFYICQAHSWAYWVLSHICLPSSQCSCSISESP